MIDKITLKTSLMRFIIVVVLSMMVADFVFATHISRVEVNPEDINPNGDFDVDVVLRGDTCNQILEFYVDDVFFSSKPVGCESDGEEITSEEWDLEDHPLGCGPHTLRVKLLDSRKKRIDDFNTTINIGKILAVAINPAKPQPNKDITLTFRDNETDKPISNLDIVIYSVREGKSSAIERMTDSHGEIIFKVTSSDVGRYELILEDSKYCAVFDFWVKKIMSVDGPHPENPVIGEKITLGVPGSVGVKYLDPEGDIHPLRNMGGGINLTINEAGNYTLIMGELSQEFWGVNKTLIVSEKRIPSIVIDPLEAVINKQVNITILSNGKPVENAIVRINKPTGGYETHTTGKDGLATFTPLSVGEYTVEVEKDKFKSVIRGLNALNYLIISLEADEVMVGDSGHVAVKNQQGTLVSEATVSVEGSPVSGLTDAEGKFSFSLQNPGYYRITAVKENHWGTERNVTVLGILQLRFNASEIELGDSAEFSAVDVGGDKITVELSVIKPDGLRALIGNVYKPTEPGEYVIVAGKDLYRGANKTLVVTPHPLEVGVSASGGGLDEGEIMVNVSSHGSPISSIGVEMETSRGKEDSETDEMGTAVFRITGTGKTIISVNSLATKEEYETVVLNMSVGKQYNFLLLIASISLTFVATVVAVLVAYFLYRKRKKVSLDKATGSSLSEV